MPDSLHPVNVFINPSDQQYLLDLRRDLLAAAAQIYWAMGNADETQLARSIVPVGRLRELLDIGHELAEQIQKSLNPET